MVSGIKMIYRNDLFLNKNKANSLLAEVYNLQEIECFGHHQSWSKRRARTPAAFSSVVRIVVILQNGL